MTDAVMLPDGTIVAQRYIKKGEVITVLLPGETEPIVKSGYSVPGYTMQQGKMDTIGLFQGPQRIESYKPKTEDYFIMDYHLPAVIQSPPSEPRLVGPIPCRCCCRC